MCGRSFASESFRRLGFQPIKERVAPSGLLLWQDLFFHDPREKHKMDTKKKIRKLHSKGVKEYSISPSDVVDASPVCARSPLRLAV